MNGATAEPDVNTIRLPSRSKQTIIGSIQNFFRSFMKDQSSDKNCPIVISSLFELISRVSVCDNPTADRITLNIAASDEMPDGACG